MHPSSAYVLLTAPNLYNRCTSLTSLARDLSSRIAGINPKHISLRRYLARDVSEVRRVAWLRCELWRRRTMRPRFRDMLYTTCMLCRPV